MATKKGEKRLVADIPEEVHQKIRISAANRNIPIKDYVLEALMEKLVREEKYK